MVGATGSNQTARARSTATAFSFNASTGALSATTEVLSGNLSAWNATTPGTGIGGLHLGAASGTSNVGPALTFGARDASSGTNAQAGIYINSDGAYGTRMYFATTDSYVTGSRTAMSINEGGVVNFSRATPTSGGNTIWHAGNDGSGSGLDADLLDGLSSGSFVRTDASSTISSSNTLSFDSTTRQMLNLWSTSYGLGVQSGTLYYRSGSRFSWHRGGTHSDTENAPGTGGTVAMTLDGSSNLAVTGTVTGSSIIRSGGTSSQFLKADGSVDSNAYITSASVGNGTLTLNVSGTGLSGSQTFTANQSGNATFTVTSNATSANTVSALVARDASGNFSAGTISGAFSASADQAIVNQNNGNAAAWYGRILSKNSTSDRASFLGTYGTIAGVFAHNNALNAWADLYVNTVDGIT